MGLEGFVDWMNLRVSESAEEEEAEMSSLVSGVEAYSRKCPKPSSPEEEAQRSPPVIYVDSQDEPSMPSRLWRVLDECKTHLCFESNSHAIFEYFISQIM